MKHDINLSTEAITYLRVIGGMTIELDTAEYNSFSIHVPAKNKPLDIANLPYKVFGLVQIDAQVDNLNITSLIYISDESHMAEFVIEQTPYDKKSKRLCCEIKGVFLSYVDVTAVLSYLVIKFGASSLNLDIH